MASKKKKTYDVRVIFKFDGVFEIKAESQEQAEEYARKHCGMTTSVGIHSTLPDEEVDWIFSSHPEKMVGNECN